MSETEKRINELGFTIPVPAPPIGSFASTVTCGPFIYVSGHASILKDVVSYKGQVGNTISPEEAAKGAQIAALRCVGALKAATDLDKIKILKVNGYVNAAPDFSAHPAVINGASDFLEAAFLDRGKHARCAIGVSSLPGNACVEVEMIAQILE